MTKEELQEIRALLELKIMAHDMPDLRASLLAEHNRQLAELVLRLLA